MRSWSFCPAVFALFARLILFLSRFAFALSRRMASRMLFFFRVPIGVYYVQSSNMILETVEFVNPSRDLAEEVVIWYGGQTIQSPTREGRRIQCRTVATTVRTRSAVTRTGSPGVASAPRRRPRRARRSSGRGHQTGAGWSASGIHPARRHSSSKSTLRGAFEVAKLGLEVLESPIEPS